MVNVCVGDRVKIVKTDGGFELPVVVAIKDDSVVLRRRKKAGTLMIPLGRFHEIKKFRGASKEYRMSVKLK